MSQDKETFQYSYPRPALTADCVVFGLSRDDVEVLLIERKNEPYAGKWAFPGGFVEENELVEQGAARELKEETLLKNVHLHPLNIFSSPGRDPRGWSVSMAYFACVSRDEMANIHGRDDAAKAQWFPIDKIPPLAFDHQQIFEEALTQLRHRMRIEPLAFDFLNRFFTFDDADVLMSSLFGPEKDTFEWLERMQELRLVKIHNEDIPSFIFNRAAYEELPTTSPYYLL